MHGDINPEDEASSPINLKRRQVFVKAVGISYSSRFIPIILDECKSCIDEMEVGSEVDMSEYASKLAFNIICRIEWFGYVILFVLKV